MTTYKPGDHLRTPVDVEADAASALADKRPNGWRAWQRWNSYRIVAVIGWINDNKDDNDSFLELSEKMTEELDKRIEEHQTKINNGGVLP